MEKVFIRSIYNQRPGRVQVEFTEPSLTQQQFKDECDINHIMQRYRETGFLTDPLKPATTQPQFGDFTGFDFMEAQNTIARANELFASLPSKVRERFGNDPGKLLAFVDDESNIDEAVKLGLMEKPPTAVETPTVTPSVTPEGGATS